MSGYCIPCRSRTSRDHYATAKHRQATLPREYRRGAGDWLDARPPRPVRDWDAEAAASSIEAELAALIEYGALPDPTPEYDADVAIITLAEAAKRLGMSATTLRHQARTGRLRAQLYGKTYVISEAELARYQRESRGKPGRPRKVAG